MSKSTKPIVDLSKDEILGMLFNLVGDISFGEIVTCAICGEGDHKFHYICDKCEEELAKDVRWVEEKINEGKWDS